MSSRFEIKLSPELRADIDSWRRAQAEIPNRADAARELIAIGLRAAPERDAR